MNIAKLISKAAKAEKLTYWEYYKKNQDKRLLIPGVRYERVDTVAALEIQRKQNEERRIRNESKDRAAGLKFEQQQNTRKDVQKCQYV